jgi:parallel beta-helix repeat protein
MTPSIRPLHLILIITCAVAVYWTVAQGPLIPPGAPAPTMKTLDQIEPRTPISALPFTISASGSYYLTASLTAAANVNGITINASNVTLDLRGFEVIGTPGTAIFGIRVSVGRSNVVIRDGTVRNWPGSGVVVENTAVPRVRVENVQANDNGSGGIALGIDSVVVDCTASGNVAHGISGSTGCKVLRCTANGQTGGSSDGFNFGAHTVMTDCVAKGNAQDGITTGQDSVLSNCLADGNAALGFVCGERTVIDRCLASDNGSTGFRLLSGCSVANSAASGNGLTGLFAPNACALESFSATSNSGDGIQSGTGATLKNCSAVGNSGAFGINAGAGSTLVNCSARANTSTLATSAGITTAEACTLIGCTSSGNLTTNGTPGATTGAGIITGNGCVLQGCTIQSNRGNGINAGAGANITSSVVDTNQGPFGISVSTGSTVANCSVRGNLSATATSAGISAGFGCTISGCSVSDTDSTAGTLTATTGMGISVTNGSTVRDCTVRNSRGDGIRATVDCSIIGNQCETNGLGTGDGAGIHVTATGNRVDGNHVAGNDRGIDVDSVANTIVRNTATGNPVNYDIVAGNSIGAIVLPGNSVLINTNVAQASSLGTTDPWANLSE